MNNKPKKDFLGNILQTVNKPKDYLGQDLNVGDLVVFMELGARSLTKGLLISNTAPTGGSILAVYEISGKPAYKKVYKQKYAQMIRVNDPTTKNMLIELFATLKEL